MAYSHSDLPRPTATVVPRSKIQTIAQAYHYGLSGFHAVVDMIAKFGATSALDAAAAQYWDAVAAATIDPPDPARLPSILGLLASADGLVAVEVDRRAPDASVAAAEKILDSAPGPAVAKPRAAGVPSGGGWPWWAKVAAVVGGVVVGRKLIGK